MVSLENISEYLKEISENIKLIGFRNLLYDKEFIVSEKNGNDNYIAFLQSVSQNNKHNFNELYNQISKRTPSKESPSPFVNDDFLIFIIILGVEKYNCDKSWIKNIINIRNRNQITITFENLLNGNYYSLSNLSEIVVSFLYLCNQSRITNDLLNDAYKSIISNSKFLFQNKNDFQTICALRAYDLIIELKTSPNGSEINLLKEFDEKFTKRVKYLSSALLFCMVILLLYSIKKLFFLSPTIKNIFDDYSPVIGFFGLSLNFIPALKNNFYEIILRVFGYPKELANAVIKKIISER